VLVLSPGRGSQLSRGDVWAFVGMGHVEFNNAKNKAGVGCCFELLCFFTKNKQKRPVLSY
jgi:hypothetical protein